MSTSSGKGPCQIEKSKRGISTYFSRFYGVSSGEIKLDKIEITCS